MRPEVRSLPCPFPKISGRLWQAGKTEVEGSIPSARKVKAKSGAVRMRIPNFGAEQETFLSI